MKEIIINSLIIFSFTLLNNIFATCRTIFVAKEKYWLSSLAAGISCLFNSLALIKAVSSGNLIEISAMCIGTFIGNLIPGLIIKKTEKEKMYIFDITSDTLENGMSFAETIRDLNIPIRTTKVHNMQNEKTIVCKVYCQSKEESRIVKENIPNTFIWTIHVPIHSEL